ALQRSRDYQRIQCGGSGRQSDRNAAAGIAAEIQAGQSGRASTLYRADGTFSAGAVDHAAPTQPDHAGVARAVARSPAVRLESTRLPRRDLVLQPVLLAGVVRVRLMVGARRG